MNKITCGKCAKKQKLSLDERKELANLIQEGLNGCECGRVLEWNGTRLIVIEEGK